LRQLIVDYGLQKRVVMAGSVEGDRREDLFSRSDMVIVPSHRESFGMVVTEALARAIAVIASRGTPWKRLEEVGCGLWVQNSPEALAEAIGRMAGLPLRHMGAAGRAWMEREFSWSAIAHRMVDVYGTLARPRALSYRYQAAAT
jgi:glycosyltransferase involved in cell wall biosynthesis